MTHKFPIIKRIEDVLPAIVGRDEFFVAERDGFIVINYTVAYDTSFEIDETDLMDNYGDMIPTGIMRRECRGIIFYPDGTIMSRPFVKFHNIGEREDTRIENIDMTRDHIIMEKMDGSMIRPMFVDGKVRLGTKMGITDVAVEAEGVVSDSQLEWMGIMMLQHCTPLFEYVSPENRIVLEYDAADLVLLAVRNNITGDYMDITLLDPNDFFTVVPTYGSVSGTLDDYVAQQRTAEGREGFIIQFDDGQMVKGKNDWYVRIHRVKDKIRTDRHVLALLLENELDDVYPVLMDADYDRVKQYEADFHTRLEEITARITNDAAQAVLQANGDRKLLATVILPNSVIPKEDWKFVFKVADGSAVPELIMSHIKSKLGNTVKYNELAAWMGLSKDKGGDE
jgi:RNA ligase